MRKISLYLFAVLSIAAIISCQKKAKDTGVEYFRSLQFSETPFDLEKGIHKLTAEEAKNVNSYKFTYDSVKRLVSVEFVRNDVLLPYSSMRGVSKIAYTYDGNKQVKNFFDRNNLQIESEGVYSAEFTLDENGLRQQLNFFDKEGTPVENRNKIHYFTWAKLPDGMIRENRYNLKNEEMIMNEFCPFYELRFTYNDKGYVTRMANYQADTLYNCTAENCGDVGVSYFAFESTGDGDLTSFSVHNTTGRLSNLYWGWAKRVNKVDKNGYVVETAIYDQDDEYLGGKNVPVIGFVVDEHGSVVEIRNMDKDRNVIDHPESGVAVTQYKYDDKGMPTDTLRLDKNMVAVAKKG
jgi:hypothetical protein